jgi:SnoaL-like domain
LPKRIRKSILLRGPGPPACAVERKGAFVATAPEVVEQYQRAFGSGDVQSARSLLADDLHFEGPIDQFERADDYMESVAKLHQIVNGIDVKKILADANDVVTIYDMHTTPPRAPRRSPNGRRSRTARSLPSVSSSTRVRSRRCSNNTNPRLRWQK